MRGPVSLHLHQHKILPLFFILTIPIGMSWYIIMVLICISLMANNVDYVFMCLFAICIFFSEKCLFMCNHFLIELFICYCWVLRVLYIFQIWVRCWMCSVMFIFSNSVDCFVIFFTGVFFFFRVKVSYFHEVRFISFFFFYGLHFWCYMKRSFIGRWELAGSSEMARTRRLIKEH